VKTLNGKTISFKIKVTARAKDVKEKVLCKEGIPLDQQRLIFAGRQLKDEEILDYVGIKDDSTLHLVLRLRGGGPGILLSADGLLDERFHFDFTSVVDKKAYSRGGLAIDPILSHLPKKNGPSRTTERRTTTDCPSPRKDTD
jgi:ubiquitin